MRQKHKARVRTDKHRQGQKKSDMKRKGEGQGACLHLEKQKEKERSYSKDVCLWQGHWVRPHWTKFVRHIYLCDYKIKYISLPSFENNPSSIQNAACILKSQAAHTANGLSCSASSHQLKQNFKGSPVNIFSDLSFLNSYQNVFSPAVSQLQNAIQMPCLFF